MTCHLCTEFVPLPGLLDHYRLLHPDTDAAPQTWPDGEIVVHEEFASLADAG